MMLAIGDALVERAKDWMFPASMPSVMTHQEQMRGFVRHELMENGLGVYVSSPDRLLETL